jgi:hypothetical protein
MTACGTGTQPFTFDGTDPDTGGTGTDTGTTDPTGTTTDEASENTGTLHTGTALPPGTNEPSSTEDVLRFEADNGTGGLVTSVTYIPKDDEFIIDNLGFDGANVYKRDNQVGTLKSYAVYEADTITFDSLTGEPIDQIGLYRAIVGVSKNSEDGEARSSFAIVRTGGYEGYGFGGFIYERNGEVTLPNAGQARFAGDYAGIRVFSAGGGLEFTRGDMTIDIDFRDFNANDAVKGRVFNREAFEPDGTPIILGAGGLQLPSLQFTIVEGTATLTENGELSGTLNNTIVNEQGVLEEYETGTYYGIIGGDMTAAGDGGELVGIFVVESEDPRYENITVQETGGFILYR